MLLVLVAKHLVALYDFAFRRETLTETRMEQWVEKLGDPQVYFTLLAGLLKERFEEHGSTEG